MANTTSNVNRKKYQTKVDLFHNTKFDYALAAAVLTEPVEKAIEFLKAGGYQNIPPTAELFYVNAAEMARFYRTGVPYIKEAFGRIKLSRVTAPDDVIFGSRFLDKIKVFAGKVNVPGCQYRLTYSADRDKKKICNYTFCDVERGCGDSIRLSFNKSETVYSARVFLAMSAIICHGYAFPYDSPAIQIYHMLKRSEYGTIAWERVASEKTRLCVEHINDTGNCATEFELKYEVLADGECGIGSDWNCFKQEDSASDTVLPEYGFDALSETLVNLISNIVSRGVNKGLSQIKSTPPEPVPSVSLQMNEPAAVSDNRFNLDNRKRA